MDRRQSLFGFLSATFASMIGTKEEPFKGFINIHLDVLGLAPPKVDSFVIETVKRFKEKMPKGWKVIVMPNRYEGSSLEVFAIEKRAEREIKSIELKFVSPLN